MRDVNELTRIQARLFSGNRGKVKDTPLVFYGFKAGAEWERNRDKWNSPDEIPDQKHEYFDSLSGTVLVTDGKDIHEGYYDYDNKKWTTDIVMKMNIIGWQYMPALPK